MEKIRCSRRADRTGQTASLCRGRCQAEHFGLVFADRLLLSILPLIHGFLGQ